VTAALAIAHARWLQSGSEADLTALTWAAVRRMQADLPPAGPDEVEADVAEMFRQWDIPSCAQTVDNLTDEVEE
jgi:hypothetical protein